MNTDIKDELMHYGILGMKWGAHRASRNGETYTYKSHTTKKYEKLAESSKKKGDAIRS